MNSELCRLITVLANCSGCLSGFSCSTLTGCRYPQVRISCLYFFRLGSQTSRKTWRFNHFIELCVIFPKKENGIDCILIYMIFVYEFI